MEIQGFGFPHTEDLTSESQLNQIIDHRIRLYNRDHEANVRHKARTLVDITDEAEKIRYSRKRTPYWFVTINPKPGVSLKELHDKIVDVLSNPYITDQLWSYEIRQAPDLGLHAHMFFRCGFLDDNFCKRKIKAPFVPDICGNLKAVHIRWIDIDEVKSVQAYIRKDTVSKSKSKANEATLQWREQRGIPMQFGEESLLVYDELFPDDHDDQQLVPLN